MSEWTLMPGEREIALNDPLLQYTGRVDDSDPAVRAFELVATSLRLVVQGHGLRLQVTNRTNYYQSRLGVIVNGEQRAILLPENGTAVIDLGSALTRDVNDVLLFKRQDASHMYTIDHIAVSGTLLPPPARPARRIEFYGDSVTAGEVTEAEECVGKPDPENHVGRYSNSWWGYAWQTARLLHAEMHDMGQGGISLQDGAGYFNGPDCIGMLSTWDKCRYNPCFGPAKPWDMTRWTPHVVVCALGQNDAHPDNYMADDPSGAKADAWRADYTAFVQGLRRVYPHAAIVLTTTILNHNPAWDDAIDAVCRQLRAAGDSSIHHFLYSSNGCGTPGHIRRSEGAVMAQELSSFINSLGEDVWQDA